MFRETATNRTMRLLRYSRRFGPTRGALLFAQTLLPTRSTALHLPGYPGALRMRPHTSDVPTFGQIFVAREYDFDFGYLKPRVIIDAGANVGYSTAFFAQRFPEAKILAIEPDPGNFELLVENTRAFPGVTTVQRALWSSRTELQIANPDAEPWEFRVEEASGRAARNTRVQTLTVPDALERLGADHVDVLKLDIEGAERELFGPSCQSWVHRVSGIIIELHDRYQAGCAQAFYRAIAHLEYTQQVLSENTFILMNPGPPADVAHERPR